MNASDRASVVLDANDTAIDDTLHKMLCDLIVEMTNERVAAVAAERERCCKVVLNKLGFLSVTHKPLFGAVEAALEQISNCSDPSTPQPEE